MYSLPYSQIKILTLFSLPTSSSLQTVPVVSFFPPLFLLSSFESSQFFSAYSFTEGSLFPSVIIKFPFFFSLCNSMYLLFRYMLPSFTCFSVSAQATAFWFLPLPHHWGWPSKNTFSDLPNPAEIFSVPMILLPFPHLKLLFPSSAQPFEGGLSFRLAISQHLDVGSTRWAISCSSTGG